MFQKERHPKDQTTAPRPKQSRWIVFKVVTLARASFITMDPFRTSQTGVSEVRRARGTRVGETARQRVRRCISNLSCNIGHTEFGPAQKRRCVLHAPSRASAETSGEASSVSVPRRSGRPGFAWFSRTPKLRAATAFLIVVTLATVAIVTGATVCPSDARSLGLFAPARLRRRGADHRTSRCPGTRRWWRRR